MTKLWQHTKTKELIALSYYDLLDGDGLYRDLKPDETCALLLGEIKKLNERIEKLEAPTDGGAK